MKRILSLFLAICLCLPNTGLRAAAETPDGVDLLDDTGRPVASIYAEIPDLRDENVKQFRMDDGTTLAVYYGDTVHYESNGAWVDIDNRLKEDYAEYSVAGGSGLVITEQQAEGGRVTEKEVSYEDELQIEDDISDEAEASPEAEAEDSEVLIVDTALVFTSETSSEEVFIEDDNTAQSEEPEDTAVEEAEGSVSVEGEEPESQETPVTEEPEDPPGEPEAEPEEEPEEEPAEEPEEEVEEEPEARTVSEAVYVNGANSLMVSLPRQFSEFSRVGVTSRGYTLRFGIEAGGRAIAGDEAKIAPAPEMKSPQMQAIAASISALSYADVAPGMTLQYSLRGETLKENIIFADLKSTPESVSYIISAEGLQAELSADGSIVFTNGQDKIFYLFAPCLVDAAGEQSADVKVTLQSLSNGEYRIIYTPERAWLEEAGRAWPVTLDPVISGRAQSGYLLDCHVCSNYPNKNYTGNWIMPVGHDNTRGNMRLYVRWTGLPSLGNMDVVVSAHIELEGQTQGSGATVSAYMTTATWATPSLTWNNKPTYDDRVLDYVVVNSSTRQIYTWDVTAAAKKWYSGEQTNYGVVFISNKENTSGNDYGEFFSVEDPNTTPPALEIQYRKIVGLEDYWTRREISIDRAGTAYIGDSNGLLTIAETDVYYASTACPVTISHVYNSAYSSGQLYQSAPGASSFSKMQAGVGWKLNIQQTVTTYTTGLLQYLDGDGSIHYFPQTATNTYKDEDGLGLTITASGSNYTMTDRYGNTKYFGGGKLRYIQDSSGNRITYVYDSYDNRVNSITRQLNGGTAQTIATLSYNSIGVLTKITDGNGQETTYNYASGYKLMGFTRPDGTTVSYTYDSNGQLLTAKDNETLYTLTFTYDSRGLIASYSETGNTTAGASVDVYGTVGIRYYRSSGKDRVLNNADDLITSYVFDYYGRTICSSTRNVSGTLIYSATTDRYTANSGTVA